LQISSTSFNTNANYQKVIVKQLKGAWKVCCMFVCACLYCCVFALNCRITLQRARSTILCGITLALSKSWRGTILALPSTMKRVKLSGILSVLLLSMILMSSLALCCVLLLVWAGFMYASVPLLRLLNSSTRIGWSICLLWSTLFQLRYLSCYAFNFVYFMIRLRILSLLWALKVVMIVTVRLCLSLVEKVIIIV